MKTDDLIPVFLCKPGALTWSFRCPYCCTVHTHGAGAGHRVAHCAGGPYKARGYVLALADEPMEEGGRDDR